MVCLDETIQEGD